MHTVLVTINRRDIALLSLSLLPRTRSTWIGLLVLAALIAGYLTYKHGIPQSPRSLGAFLIASIGGSVCGLASSFLLFLVQISIASRESNGVLGEHTYVLREDGLHEITAVNESVVKWVGLKEVMRTNAYIYIQIAPALFHVLPRRDFKDAAAYEEFWNALNAGRARTPNNSLERTREE
jgi:hypothetical protein